MKDLINFEWQNKKRILCDAFCPFFKRTSSDLCFYWRNHMLERDQNINVNFNCRKKCWKLPLLQFRIFQNGSDRKLNKVKSVVHLDLLDIRNLKWRFCVISTSLLMQSYKWCLYFFPSYMIPSIKTSSRLKNSFRRMKRIT